MNGQIGNVFAPPWRPGINASWYACTGNPKACGATQRNQLL